MKRNVKLFGILLVLMMVASGCYFAHRRVKERMDRAQRWRHERMIERRGMNQRGQFMYRGPMNGRRGQNGPGQQGGMNPMGRGQQWGMNPMGRGLMQQGNLLNRIPNLTEKQRKEITDLRQKEMNDMMKFREETQAKVQSMRQENRKKIMDLLTDEQKKFLESAPPMPNQPVQMPAPVKQ